MASKDVRLGDWVRSLVAQTEDDGTVAAEPRDHGEVLATIPGRALTVFWHRTGLVFDAWPEELEVVAPVDFATRPETTPARPLKVFIKRGVQ